ncbi:MAG: helix-turn-helix domain-containing protein [Deltaproteobacteria bacterium]|nr:helix-turn-helix domain-containing protein [Deltaproteobacteria bacterium]
MQFGEYLRIIRTARGMTALALGKKVGTTGQYITQTEQGKLKAPNREMVFKLAEALEANASELWGIAAIERYEEWCKKEGIEPEKSQIFFQAARYDRKRAIQKIWSYR